MAVLRRLVLVALTLCLSSTQAVSLDSSHHQSVRLAAVLHHALEIHLIPEQHELRVVDQMIIKTWRDGVREIAFVLNARLHVHLVLERGPAGAHPLSFSLAPRAPAEAEGEAQVVTVRFERTLSAHETVDLVWQYQGAINDPPREPRHLRFVTPSETAGHIGEEGVYLSGETHWYPDVPGSLPTFTVRVTTPENWQAVTHGRQTGRTVQGGMATADWDVAARTEALTLVANRFAVKQRTWRDASGQAVTVAAYLFPDDAHLADEYLDASVRYLETYAKLLGPYPFPKFAVVENFFASGLGMPSFTLLGSGVIKRHYVQPYALGHEIVHSWIGNFVLNQVEQGNWVEGLTTYLANYYYEELTGTAEQAREQRRMMLLGYAVYVRPEEDYPVVRFTQKRDQKDNAIGYQKAAMIFHMLRREIGDDSFWRGLRALVARYGGAYAGWKELEQVFAETAKRDMRWFFAQWVERAGAPGVSIAAVDLREQRASAGEQVLKIRLTQQGDPYRVRLPVVVKTSKGPVHATIVEMESAEQVVMLSIPSTSVGLEIDPEFESFRRIARHTLPPMLNLFVTDTERAVALPSGGTDADRQPYQELAKQIVSREQGIAQISDREADAAKGSVLVLGGPGVNQAADWAIRGCGKDVSLAHRSFTIEGRTYDSPGTALLVSCRQPEHSERVSTLFSGLTPSAAAKVARLLFFYGWHSYLVFQDGAVIARGDFLPETNDLEVRFNVP